MSATPGGADEDVVMQTRRPVMLVVLDGWGWREEAADNAVRQARTPTFDSLWTTCPHAFLHTSGKDVGLPSGQMGNSEVGHLNIGAGRLVLTHVVPGVDPESQRRLAAEVFGGPVEVASTHRAFAV